MSDSASPPRSLSRRRSRWPVLAAVGTVLGVFFLWLTFRGVDGDELWRTLRGVDPRQVAVAYVLAIGVIVGRAVQWWLVLRSTKQVPVHRLFRSIMIGFLYNYLMPVRIGGLVRTGYTAKQENLPFATVLTTVGLTRVLDLLALLAIWVYAIFFSDLFTHFDVPADVTAPIVALSRLLAVAAAATMAVALGLAFFQVRSYRLARGLLRPWAQGEGLGARVARWLLAQLANFLRGLKMLRTSADFALAFAVSVVGWMLSAACIDRVLVAFDVELPLTAAVFVMVVVALGIAVPAVPGYVGQYHAACRYALAPFAVPAPQAASIALFLHAFHFSYTLVLGGLSLVGSPWRWSQWRRVGEDADGEGSPPPPPASHTP